MDIKISIALKDKTYGFSDLLNGRELNNQTKQEIIDLIKEDIGYVFDQQIEVEQLFTPDVVGRSEQLKCECKRATFTRTVDEDFNPMCGKCGRTL
jgi:hypothetical protein